MSRIRRCAPSVMVLVLAACDASTRTQQAGQPDSVATVATVAIAEAPRRQQLPARFGSIGRAASAAEIRAWDIDASVSGAGLPRGSGTYQRGVAVYAAQCASCHGPKGEGIAPNPKLVGSDPKDFPFGRDPKIPKTIGNYWPYATTLYDYINRAMPFNAPGSLPPGDVYSVVAYLLAENGIIDRGAVIDARSLPKVLMPARAHFVADDRRGGKTFR